MVVKNLKLIAKTEEDIKVVSAHLQDSILSIADIANLKKNRIFLMQLNRFMWEDVEKGVFRKNKRIRTVLKFENIRLALIYALLLRSNRLELKFRYLMYRRLTPKYGSSLFLLSVFLFSLIRHESNRVH